MFVSFDDAFVRGYIVLGRRRMHFPLLVRVVRCADTLTVTYGDLVPIEVRERV